MLDIAPKTINDINLDALTDTVAAIEADPALGQTRWLVTTDWAGQTRSESKVAGCMIGGQWIERQFKIAADEPEQLLGTNSAPNPQELLLSALNACMMVGYVAQAAVHGVELSNCRIESEGDIDLRGFLGIDPGVANGYLQIRYKVTMEGNGTRADFEAIHAAVQATSPNYFNMAQPIEMVGTLA